jgi:hypothetical protein
MKIKKISLRISIEKNYFKDPNVAKHLSLLHDKYVIVSADKAPNNIVFMCKSHDVDCLIKKLGIDNSLEYWQPYIYPGNTYERRKPGQS